MDVGIFSFPLFFLPRLPFSPYREETFFFGFSFAVLSVFLSHKEFPEPCIAILDMQLVPVMRGLM